VVIKGFGEVAQMVKHSLDRRERCYGRGKALMVEQTLDKARSTEMPDGGFN
jgi:hypothetical protein